MVHYPLANLFGTVCLATLNLNLGRTDVGLQCLITSLTDSCPFRIETEVLKHHGSRENLSQWIGNVLASCLGPRAMNRLEERRMLAQ